VLLSSALNVKKVTVPKKLAKRMIDIAANAMATFLLTTFLSSISRFHLASRHLGYRVIHQTLKEYSGVKILLDPSFIIEKSKRRMIAEDIAHALALIK
jgi:hypothetical protein